MSKRLFIISFLFLSLLSFSSSYAVDANVDYCPLEEDFLTHLADQIDSRIDGLDGTIADKQIYTTRDGEAGVWVANADVWTNNGVPLDFSGLSPWNSYFDYRMGGTLVTSKHIVFAKHYQLRVGDKVMFIDNESNKIFRNVSDTRSLPGDETYDITVASLNESVPDGVAIYPILEDELYEYLVTNYSSVDLDDFSIPMLATNQDHYAIVKNVGYSSLYTARTLGYSGVTVGYRDNLTFTLRSGDSGRPDFLVIGDKLVLLSTHHQSISGPSYGYYFDEVQGFIDEMDTGFNLSRVRFNCSSFYDSYPMLVDLPSMKVDLGTNESFDLASSLLSTGTATVFIDSQSNESALSCELSGSDGLNLTCESFAQGCSDIVFNMSDDLGQTQSTKEFCSVVGYLETCYSTQTCSGSYECKDSLFGDERVCVSASSCFQKESFSADATFCSNSTTKITCGTDGVWNQSSITSCNSDCRNGYCYEDVTNGTHLLGDLPYFPFFFPKTPVLNATIAFNLPSLASPSLRLSRLYGGSWQDSFRYFYALSKWLDDSGIIPDDFNKPGIPYMLTDLNTNVSFGAVEYTYSHPQLIQGSWSLIGIPKCQSNYSAKTIVETISAFDNTCQGLIESIPSRGPNNAYSLNSSRLNASEYRNNNSDFTLWSFKAFYVTCSDGTNFTWKPACYDTSDGIDYDDFDVFISGSNVTTHFRGSPLEDKSLRDNVFILNKTFNDNVTSLILTTGSRIFNLTRYVDGNTINRTLPLQLDGVIELQLNATYLNGTFYFENITFLSPDLFNSSTGNITVSRNKSQSDNMMIHLDLNVSNIYSGGLNLTVNLTNLTSSMMDNRSRVRVLKDQKPLFDFEHNFTAQNISFSDIVIVEESFQNKSSFAFVDLANQNITNKTVYFDLSNSSQLDSLRSICIKDTNINDVSEITIDCSASDELYVSAIPSTVEQNGLSYDLSYYNDSNLTVVITGLNHSGLSQMCTEDWQYGSWSSCKSGVKTRSATDSNSCGTTHAQASISTSCTVSSPGGSGGGSGGGSSSSPPVPVQNTNASKISGGQSLFIDVIGANTQESFAFNDNVTLRFISDDELSNVFVKSQKQLLGEILFYNMTLFDVNLSDFRDVILTLNLDSLLLNYDIDNTYLIRTQYLNITSTSSDVQIPLNKITSNTLSFEVSELVVVEDVFVDAFDDVVVPNTSLAAADSEVLRDVVSLETDSELRDYTGTVYLILGIVVVIVIIVGGILFVLLRGKSAANKTPSEVVVLNPAMINCLQWIKSQRAQGVSDEHMTVLLRTQGWDDESINALLSRK